MNGAIIYYSNTGNTKLACEYLKRSLQNIDLELISFLDRPSFSLKTYEIIGFACFTDAWQPSRIFLDYIQALGNLEGKFSFIMNTYGFISGKTVKTLYQLLKDKKAVVIAAHSLHTPENFPPMIAAGKGSAENPSDREMYQFCTFINELDHTIGRIARGERIREYRPGIGLLNSLLPASPTTFTRFMFYSNVTPAMQVDNTLCVGCGLCTRNCPVQTISLVKGCAVIDNRLCQTCWSCYNHCPVEAITYGKYTGQGQYRCPPERYRTMLG